MKRLRSVSKTSPSFQLSLVYVVFSTGWILVGDELVTQLNYSAEATERLQNAKGLLFVFSSALLLYFVSRRLYRDLRDSLKEKESVVQKLTALNEASTDGIIDYDFSNDTAVINEEMMSYLDTDKDRVKNFSSRHQDQIHPEDRSRVVENFYAFVKGNRQVWQEAYRYRNRRGIYREVIGRGYLMRDPETQQPLHMMYSLQDVTALKDANTKYYLQQLQHRQQMTLSILAAQDEERNRWAQELHDNVCQVLTVSKLLLEQAALENGPSPMQAKAQDMLEKGINDIRQLSALIKPLELKNTNLSESIQDLLSNVRRFSQAEFAVDLQPGVEQRLQEEQKVMVYRIVQEQLNNILKYAEARYVKVAVALEEKAAVVTVQDNGKGFDPETIRAGIGLKNMQDRLQVFGGHLSVISSPGQGCKVKAVFSLS